MGAGDFVALPTGPEAAHQLINTSRAPLRYLAISTMLPTDITVYPDSDKVALFAGAAPGGDKAQRTLSEVLPRGPRVDYWSGEADENDDDE